MNIDEYKEVMKTIAVKLGIAYNTYTKKQFEKEAIRLGKLANKAMDALGK